MIVSKWEATTHSFVGCLLCLAIFGVALWVSCFVSICILLDKANIESVHSSCAGFWDFMLVSVLAPVLIPIGYCLLSCGAWQWRSFSGVCMLILAITSLQLTLTAASNHECVDAIRNTTPPIPWLIYMGWVKAAVYGTGALSALRS